MRRALGLRWHAAKIRVLGWFLHSFNRTAYREVATMTAFLFACIVAVRCGVLRREVIYPLTARLVFDWLGNGAIRRG